MADLSEAEEEGEQVGDLTYSQEQDRLRQSFQEAAALAGEQEVEDSDTGEGLLVLRQKTDEEKVGGALVCINL